MWCVLNFFSFKTIDLNTFWPEISVRSIERVEGTDARWLEEIVRVRRDKGRKERDYRSERRGRGREESRGQRAPGVAGRLL